MSPSSPEPRPRAAVALTVLAWLALGGTLLAAALVAVVFGTSWFSAARIAGFLTAIAFAAAFFSAASGRDSAAAGRASAVAGRDSAEAGRDSATASAASAQTARRAYGQQLHELARATHTDLTTGEVARARDLLGSVGRRRRGLWPPDGIGLDLDQVAAVLHLPGYENPRVQLEETRRAWFTLLWCFQRVLAARELLAQAPDDATYGVETPLGFLDRLVREQVRFLNDELGHARSALEEFFRERLDDRESAAAFRALVHLVLGDDAELGRWALPLSTHAGEALRVLLLDESSDLALEDVALSQYQALHCLLNGEKRTTDYPGEREILPRRLRQRSDELRSRGGPDRPGIGDDPRSPGDLEGWARTYADPASLPVPRTWSQP